MTVPHRPNASPDLVAEHRDAAVGGAEMFKPVNRDRPLRYLRLIIARVPLAFLISAHRDLARHHLLAIHPPGRVLLGLAEMAQLDK